MTVAKKIRGKRGRKALPGGERKDRLIQTRVADDLDATLREEAKKRRVSVSQLIRNVLEDTFTLVDDVVNGTAKLAQQVRRDALRIRDSAQGLARSSTGKDFDQIEVWQAVTLTGAVRCGDCKEQLNLGEPAMMGYSSDPSVRPIWVCMNCYTGA
jgi:hypothetical protein